MNVHPDIFSAVVQTRDKGSRRVYIHVCDQAAAQFNNWQHNAEPEQKDAIAAKMITRHLGDRLVGKVTVFGERPDRDATKLFDFNNGVPVHDGAPVDFYFHETDILPP